MTHVPNCSNCGRPLGLYYAECSTCLLFASAYTLADYKETRARG